MSARDEARAVGERWRARAGCRGEDPDLFFPTAEPGGGVAYREQVAEAKAVCAVCPVRAECLTEALARIPYGIAGGLTEHERRGLGRPRHGELSEQQVAEVTRTGTAMEVAAAGRVLLGRGRPVDQVARQCGVAVDTARRWARRAPAGVEPVRAGGGAA
jgi:WhiB family redox-sensing transcriptional regulator